MRIDTPWRPSDARYGRRPGLHLKRSPVGARDERGRSDNRLSRRSAPRLGLSAISYPPSAQSEDRCCSRSKSCSAGQPRSQTSRNSSKTLSPSPVAWPGRAAQVDRATEQLPDQMRFQASVTPIKISSIEAPRHGPRMQLDGGAIAVSQQKRERETPKAMKPLTQRSYFRRARQLPQRRRLRSSGRHG